MHQATQDRLLQKEIKQKNNVNLQKSGSKIKVQRNVQSLKVLDLKVKAMQLFNFYFFNIRFFLVSKYNTQQKTYMSN